MGVREGQCTPVTVTNPCRSRMTAYSRPPAIGSHSADGDAAHKDTIMASRAAGA